MKDENKLVNTKRISIYLKAFLKVLVAMRNSNKIFQDIKLFFILNIFSYDLQVNLP